ncbi:carbon-nitrogen hydrolase family protein [Agromyces archimandritae]|uniref:Carbon-nitrogen hydrolase family protein n=2 Tax=Agromyces archimandritae TaxID=2781962 RepID=A0A975FR26_9MICO|nr:carbon-nitrogen hydrolase family protein [Agromyces archimandritae]
MTRVSVAQVGSIAFDPAATAEKAVAIVAEAAEAGSRLLLFPEAFLGTYPKALLFRSPIGRRTEQARAEFERYLAGAVELDGPEVARVAEAAAEHGVFVVLGIVERAGRTLYCTAVLISDTGEIVGHHRKVMPTGTERLIWGFGDGSTLPVVESPAGRVGAVICWENYMPLLRTAMYAQGIAVYCAPTADDRDSWLPTMTHVALEGRCHVLSACQVMRRSDYPDDYDADFGTEPDAILMRGGSVIVSPRGEIIAGPLYDEEGMLTADIDPAEVARMSFDFDVTGHYARPDIFSLHVDTGRKEPVRFGTAPGTTGS